MLVGASVRAAAESARRAGFSPIAVDRYGDRETVQAADSWHPLDDIRSDESAAQFDRIVGGNTPIAIVGGLDGGYRWIPRSCRNFWGADPAVFLLCDQVDFLRDLAARAEVLFPKTLAKGVTRPGWLLKRRSSAGGLGVTVCREKIDIPADASLQVPVRGRVCGASFLGLGDHAVLLGVCRLLKKRIGRNPFVFAGALGPIALQDSVLDSLKRLGQAFVDSTAIRGPFNADVVIGRGGVTLLEINPRWSASMEILEQSWIELMTEPCSMFDEPQQWIHRIEAAGVDPTRVRTPAETFLKRVVFARSDRTVSAEDFDVHRSDARWVWKDVPDRPVAVKRSEPLATIIARLDRLTLRQAFRIHG